MADERREISLDDLCSYLNRGTAPAYTDGDGVLVLNQKCVRDQRVTLDEARRTDPKRKPIAKERLLQPFDILVNSTGVGTLGRVAQVRALPETATVDSHMTIVRPNANAIDPSYLGLAVRCFEAQIESLGEGSTGQTELSRARLGALLVPVPKREDQRAIACILGALDDKIELNRQMTQTLEATTRAIFKSWFVDFDPVHAKAVGQEPLGLKPEIAALFPDSFTDAELGEIPKEWSVTSLADQISASKGLSYKGQHLCEPGEGLPMHNLNSVYEGGGYKHEGLKWYNGEHRPAHLLKPGDVIVTNTEQGFDYLLIGFSAIVPDCYGPQGLFSHHIFRIRPKSTSYLPAWFTYLLLRTQRFHDLVAGHSNGTTVNMLPLDGLQKPQFVLPPKALVERFEALFLPAQQRIERIHEENAALAALRDTLMPKLISGELVIAEAERIAGRCA